MGGENMQTETNLIVRYAETDQMGIVHHSNYPIWFEIGRTAFLKQLGLSYSSIEAKGIMLPLYEINCKYKSPAKYEDEISVITSLESITRTRIIFSYQVKNVLSDAVIATGQTMHAWTNTSLRPINAEKVIPEVFMLLNK
jgi:acyl-CoA thioester hydrolase